MQLDVFSDVICPWCYLGHRRLRAAINRVGAHGIDLTWRAFRLDPRAPTEPGDLHAVIEATYGPGAFARMTRRLVALGTEVGIDYRFDQALRVNTLDAHRLIQWTAATRPDSTGALVDRLFRAYFTEGANVAEQRTLVRLGTEVGLDPGAVAEALASGAAADTVQADQAEALELGITGVPAVVFNGATIIPGAQDVDTMARILERVRNKVG